MLWSALQANLLFFEPYRLLSFLVDFVLNCVAVLSAFTIASGYPEWLNLALVIPATLIRISAQFKNKRSKRVANGAPAAGGRSERGTQDPFPIKPFVTTYRGTMIVATCVAILAVDFHVFPRRYAKVETWGTSLMDLGVGSFVFSAGTVSVRPKLKQELSSQAPSFWPTFVSSLRHAFPLLVLGMIRLYSVKSLDYAEHASEYGFVNHHFNVRIPATSLKFTVQCALELLLHPWFHSTIRQFIRCFIPSGAFLCGVGCASWPGSPSSLEHNWSYGLHPECPSR